MAVLIPVVATLVGANPGTYSAAAGGGDVFAASSGARYLIHVKNGHTSPQNVIVDDPRSVAPAGATTFVPDVTVVVTNAQERVILISDPARFINTSGQIALTYSGVTLLTLKVFQV